MKEKYCIKLTYFKNKKKDVTNVIRDSYDDALLFLNNTADTELKHAKSRYKLKDGESFELESNDKMNDVFPTQERIIKRVGKFNDYEVNYVKLELFKFDWQYYYKPPFFALDTSWDLAIYGNEDGECISWAFMYHDYYDGVYSKEFHQWVVDRLNKKETDFTPNKKHTFRLDEKNAEIYMDDEEKPLLIIRGYGMLTGTGAYNLPDEEAVEIMLSLGKYAVEQLNR